MTRENKNDKSIVHSNGSKSQWCPRDCWKRHLRVALRKPFFFLSILRPSGFQLHTSMHHSTGQQESIRPPWLGNRLCPLGSCRSQQGQRKHKPSPLCGSQMKTSSCLASNHLLEHHPWPRAASCSLGLRFVSIFKAWNMVIWVCSLHQFAILGEGNCDSDMWKSG